MTKKGRPSKEIPSTSKSAVAAKRGRPSKETATSSESAVAAKKGCSSKETAPSSESAVGGREGEGVRVKPRLKTFFEVFLHYFCLYLIFNDSTVIIN